MSYTFKLFNRITLLNMMFNLEMKLRDGYGLIYYCC